ncbi:MAG TPA: FixH family protein [Ktedonobacteraceae bacterium]|jgi:nitrogen fixation protein FixH|nr:FixH family protein [Ktedonobacteraceae bacterium]
MRRGLLVIALGIAFLVLMTWLATIVTETFPRTPTPQTQTAQAGPYTVTLEVSPNPPPTTKPATLTITVKMKSSGQPVNNAQVSLASNMTAMDMGTETVQAQSQHDGTYVAQVQFVMSGPWQVQVTISQPGKPSATATFNVTAQ